MNRKRRKSSSFDVGNSFSQGFSDFGTSDFDAYHYPELRNSGFSHDSNMFPSSVGDTPWGVSQPRSEFSPIFSSDTGSSFPSVSSFGSSLNIGSGGSSPPARFGVDNDEGQWGNASAFSASTSQYVRKHGTSWIWIGIATFALLVIGVLLISHHSDAL